MDERHQSITVSAKTVDDAIAEAEQELGVSRENLDITVITEGKGGFLGMGSENARILAVVMTTTAPTTTGPRERAAKEPRPRRSSHTPAVRDTRPEDEAGDEQEERPHTDYAEVAAIAQEILESLLRHMDIEARVSIRQTDDPVILDVATDDGGLLIGRRGETLSSLQYLVNVLVGKRTRGWTKVIIDIEGWRSRREDTLRNLAQRQANRARQQGRPVSLEPMPASERRIVHLALQDEPDIETHSEGEEPYRHLVITLKRY